MVNRFHPKGHKTPDQIKAIKAKEAQRNRPIVSFLTEEEQKKAIQKARIELLNNIPTKSDSPQLTKTKRKRHNELLKKLEMVS